jgi:hypothetical protein
MVGVTNRNTNEKGQVRRASILFGPRWPRSWTLFAAVVLTLLAFGKNIPMLKYGIENNRNFWANDLRFLEQFG